MEDVPNRIEKQVFLRAPTERVWEAISDSKKFGTWFGAEFDGPFVAGARVTGRIVPTQVDAAVAKGQGPYAGMACDLLIERMEPPRHFSFRWQSYAPEPGEDPTKVPTTLVTFELEPVDHGTMLTITESGFDQLPPARRAKAFTDNEGGWTIQTMLIGKYLALAA